MHRLTLSPPSSTDSATAFIDRFRHRLHRPIPPPPLFFPLRARHPRPCPRYRFRDQSARGAWRHRRHSHHPLAEAVASIPCPPGLWRPPVGEALQRGLQPALVPCHCQPAQQVEKRIEGTGGSP
jgi:hypothetical protein